jgi:hypothetical protein
MRARLTFSLAALALVTFALGAVAQERRPSGTSFEDGDQPDLTKFHPFHRTIYLSCRRGAEWLWQANRPDGLFLPGEVPALKTVLDTENFLDQAQAAWALARAASFVNSPRYAARAKQAILVLLTSTKADPSDAAARFTVFASSQVNRLAAGAWLILAIHETPEPGEDLLTQAEQLANYLRKQQQPDGSLHVPPDLPAGEAKPRGEVPGAAEALAILAVAKSQSLRPAPWKLEWTRKAVSYQRAWWPKNKHPLAAARLASAAAETAAVARDRASAELAFEVTDWLCTLQYGPDPKTPLWHGGFAGWEGGRSAPQPPTADGAVYCGALADACRAARQVGDATRFDRYKDAIERGLQFVTTLQYTAGNTGHFAEWYQPRLIGAFHASHTEGDIRLAETAQATAAMIPYLASVAEVPGIKPAGRSR